MKKLVLMFLLACDAAFAIDPMLSTAGRFAEALGLRTNAMNNPVVHWQMPTNILAYAEQSGRFQDISGHGDYRISMTNSVGATTARVELREYRSNEEALVCISFLAGGGGSALPEDIATLSTVRTNCLGIVEIGDIALTPSIRDACKWCLYRNIGIECRAVPDIDAMNLSTIILRAGGVEIPDAPAQPPTPDPNQ